MKRLLVILCVLLFLLFSSTSLAADHCVTASGAGGKTGADWDNAYEGIPSPLVRDDTYYIAEGSYSELNIDDAVDGTKYITIKKATASAHGPETGWSDSMGDEQAVFTYTDTNPIICIRVSYVIIDGVTGGGPGSWDSGHGIKVTSEADVNFLMLGYKYGGTPYPDVDHVTMTHLELSGLRSPGVGNGIEATSSGQADDVTISYCYIHDIGGAAIDPYCADRWTIEYNHIHGNASSIAHHGVSIRMDYSNDFTIRYNMISDIVGTGWIGKYTGDDDGNNTAIYGNVFYYTNGFNPADYGGYPLNGCIFVNSSQQTGDNWYIYNNTFYNLSYYLIVRLQDNGSNHYAYNNLAYDVEGTPGYVNVTANYNSEVTPDPFVDSSTYDFHLTAATTDGTDLESPYNTDPDGLTRGIDVIWDIGAYEFTGSASPTGTVVVEGGLTESDMVTGDKYADATLTGTTWGATVGADNEITTALVQGLDSNKSEATGWNTVIRDTLTHAAVSRTSDTVVRITFPAAATYDITASETIALTIPAAAVESGVEIVATPTFIISVDTPASSGHSIGYSATGYTGTYNASGHTVTVP